MIIETFMANQTKLDRILEKLQEKEASDEFIYGVTNRASRTLWQRINDFFIDHSLISSKEKGYFFELLATMIRAGIPLNRALKILKTRTENLRLRRITETLSYEIEHGRSFSQALDRFPEIFGETERGIVRSAEAVGTLEQILFKIAANLNRRNDLSMRLMGALVYPIAVIITLIIGISVLLVFVVPRIQEIFENSTLSLPFATRVLMKMSLTFSEFWWIFLIILIFLIIAVHLYIHSDEGRFAWDFRKLKIPFLGPLLRKIIVFRFIDTLGLLIESGLPINRALEFTAGALGNEIYRLKTYDVLGAVQTGKSLSGSLATAPFLFPETITNMLAVGENTATLGALSQKIALHFEREIDYTLKNLTTVLGPVLILVVGLTVAFFALAVLSPLFSLGQLVQ